MSFIGQSLTPLNYIRIKHSVKPWFDLYIPLALSTLVFAIVIFLPKEPKLFGEGGLIFVITDLIKILSGFYIASLAAVATFQKPEMDQELAGDPATLKVKRKGVSKLSKLSRRRFLCYLFGYLAFSSIAIYFVGAFSSLIADSVKVIISAPYLHLVKWIFTYIYLFATANLLSTTLLGLHFMTDRIHR